MEPTQAQQHRDAVCKRLSANGKKFFKFIEFDENEELVAEIRKHPIGLTFVIFIGLFILLAIVALTTVLVTANLNQASGVSVNNYKPIFLLVGFLLALGVAFMTIIGAWLYVHNVIFVTSEKLAQVLYVNLFNRKISQLSIGDVQDVTVTQKGILAHIFNYGTLVVETAGEQQNYTFTYIPDPYKNSQLIVGAHEANLKAYGN